MKAVLIFQLLFFMCVGVIAGEAINIFVNYKCEMATVAVYNSLPIKALTEIKL